jgi:signal transduction histidine kinase
MNPVGTGWQDRQIGQAEAMRVLVHELKSPVAVSKSLAASTRYLKPGDPRIPFILGRIEERLDQLLDLVDDIVDLSCIKTGDPMGDPVVFDLAAASRMACEPYLEQALVNGLTMTLDLPDSPLRVCMAEQAYRLVLSNVVSNAVKYTPTGSVRVTLRQEEAWAVLEVKDSGIGIPPDEIPRLFTEFFRASNARRDQIPGTGLGLVGVKELVERSGGSVEVASKQGAGSCFTVRLPIFSASAAPANGRHQQSQWITATTAVTAMPTGPSSSRTTGPQLIDGTLPDGASSLLGILPVAEFALGGSSCVSSMS